MLLIAWLQWLQRQPSPKSTGPRLLWSLVRLRACDGSTDSDLGLQLRRVGQQLQWALRRQVVALQLLWPLRQELLRLFLPGRSR